MRPPYRYNIGIALFDATGKVLAGRRFADDGPEIIAPGKEWQLPQGGVDPGEDIIDAARRELWEETSVTSAEFLHATEEWWTYDFPPCTDTAHPLMRYRGQQQRWVAFRFTGDPAEINVTHPPAPHIPEFDAHAFLPLEDVVRHVIDFRKPVYEKIARVFVGQSILGE